MKQNFHRVKDQTHEPKYVPAKPHAHFTRMRHLVLTSSKPFDFLAGWGERMFGFGTNFFSTPLFDGGK